ncbi:MAG: hypothetical protein IT336_11030, partial [Thermomicrobiales bacterium]|nr:hypothetical protein [Thermomicrobiales bacterium]
MKRLRRMGPLAKAFFYGMLAIFGVLALVALAAGWWLLAVASVLLGIAFVSSAPFVLGKGWEPPPRTP